MKVIAYTYDADYHCEDCATKLYGSDEDGWVPEGAEDSEGNDVHPVFDTDEWYANDVYEGNESATLCCGDCLEVIETIDLA